MLKNGSAFTLGEAVLTKPGVKSNRLRPEFMVIGPLSEYSRLVSGCENIQNVSIRSCEKTHNVFIK